MIGTREHARRSATRNSDIIWLKVKSPWRKKRISYAHGRTIENSSMEKERSENYSMQRMQK